MAIEAYIVAFDIKDAGPGWQKPLTKELGVAKETSIGVQNGEGSGVGTSASLAGQGVNGVATAKLVEVLAPSAAAAVEVVRKEYGSNAGGVRAVVKPNETNFRVVV